MENACSVSAGAIWVKEDDIMEDKVVGFVHMVDAGMGCDPFAQ